MSTNVTEPSENEIAVRDALSQAVVHAIAERGMTREELAEALALPATVAASLSQPSFPWSAELAMRVADALDIEWRVEVQPRAA